MGQCVVSRRARQQVRVGEAVITILRAGGNVRLGIEAPPHVPIVRCELPLREPPSPPPVEPQRQVIEEPSNAEQPGKSDAKRAA